LSLHRKFAGAKELALVITPQSQTPWYVVMVLATLVRILLLQRFKALRIIH